MGIETGARDRIYGEESRGSFVWCFTLVVVVEIRTDAMAVLKRGLGIHAEFRSPSYVGGVSVSKMRMNDLFGKQRDLSSG